MQHCPRFDLERAGDAVERVDCNTVLAILVLLMKFLWIAPPV